MAVLLLKPYKKISTWLSHPCKCYCHLKLDPAVLFDLFSIAEKKSCILWCLIVENVQLQLLTMECFSPNLLIKQLGNAELSNVNMIWLLVKWKNWCCTVEFFQESKPHLHRTWDHTNNMKKPFQLAMPLW